MAGRVHILWLEYPNGRTHRTTLEAPEELRAGSEFELYGRRWRVAQALPAQRGYPVRLLCRPADDPQQRRDSS